MSRIRCPSCLEASAEEVNRRLTDAGLERTFECEHCGHVWSVAC